MFTTRPTRQLRVFAILATFAAIIPGCHHQGGLRGDYAAARPTYAPPSVQPMRLGGYAGYNYGRGPVAVPVRPIEDEEPSLGRGRRSNVVED